MFPRYIISEATSSFNIMFPGYINSGATAVQCGGEREEKKSLWGGPVKTLQYFFHSNSLPLPPRPCDHLDCISMSDKLSNKELRAIFTLQYTTIKPKHPSIYLSTDLSIYLSIYILLFYIIGLIFLTLSLFKKYMNILRKWENLRKYAKFALDILFGFS